MYSANLVRLIAELGRKRSVLVGIGNPRCGDDGAGMLLVGLLARRLRHDNILCLMAGSNPENHLAEIRAFNPDIVILFDAARFTGAEGEIRLLEPGSVDAHRISTHTYSLPIFMSYLEREVNCSVRLIGIRGTDYALRDPGSRISPPVRARIEEFMAWMCGQLSKVPGT